MNVNERYATAQAFKQALTRACRALGEPADDEELAAFVRVLVEPIVKERRGRAKEISELRARMGRLAETTTAGSVSGDSSSPAVAQKGSASALVHEEETALGLNTADIVVEATRTDGTSVSDSLALPKRKLRSKRIAAGGAVLIALGAISIWIFGGRPASTPSASEAPAPTTSSSAASVDSTSAPEIATPIPPAPSSESQTSPQASGVASAAPHVGARPHGRPHTAGNGSTPSILPASPYGSKK